MPPKTAAYRRKFELLACLLCVFALLICNAAACLACRLAGCLALTATAVLCTCAKVFCIKSFDMLHNLWSSKEYIFFSYYITSYLISQSTICKKIAATTRFLLISTYSTNSNDSTPQSPHQLSVL